MKYCEEYAALLDPFVDGELSPEEAAHVRAHLTVCDGCRSYVDAALTMREGFPNAEDTDVPEGFAGRVMSAIQAEAVSQTKAAPQKKPVPWKKVLLPMAACLAIVVAAGQLPRIGGGSDAAETAAAQYQASTEESAGETETSSRFNRVTEEKGEPVEDSVQVSDEKRSMTVFSSQDSASENSQEAIISDSAHQADGQAGKEIAPETPTVSAASTQAYGRRAQVSLTAEQQARLLGDYEAEAQPDGTVRYSLTAEAFDAVAAALKDEGVQFDIQQNEEAGPDLCYLIVTVE